MRACRNTRWAEDELVTVTTAHVRGGTRCSVNSMLSLAIDQPKGRRATRLRGNPAKVELHSTLDVGEKVAVGWVIGSWCGSREDVIAVADLEGLTASRPLGGLPGGEGDCPLVGIYSLYES
jgi:hypothetical protein